MSKTIPINSHLKLNLAEAGERANAPREVTITMSGSGFAFASIETLERMRDAAIAGIRHLQPVDLRTVEAYLHGDLRRDQADGGGGHRWNNGLAEQDVPSPWRVPDAILCWNARRSRDGRELSTGELEQVQGAACLRRRDGWTALAWWDRTGDRRGGSNTVLVARARLSFAEMIELLSIRFTWMLDRQTAPLTEREPVEDR